MADSIPGPWIVDYLINIAEEYGANLSAVPWKGKAVKAQLVKFLTFPPPGCDGSCSLWAEISDKKHIIRARLSVDAILAYERNPIHGGRPITAHKSAFVSLKKFRPALGRVARRDGPPGLTSESTLFLDVDEILLKGAYGEPMWGSPAEVASDDPRIREWIHGLRQDGGAGNVLKLRKQEALARAAEREAFETRAASKPLSKPPVQTTINAAVLDTKVRVARKSGGQRSRASLTAEDTNDRRSHVDKEVLRRAAWKRFHTKVIKYFRPPDDILEQLMSLSGQALSTSTVKRRAQSHSPSRSGSCDGVHYFPRRSPSQSASSERLGHNSRALTPQFSPPPRSPSHWSPSERGSPQRRSALDDDSSETEEEPDLDEVMDVADSVPDDAVDKEGHAPEPPETITTTEDDSQGAGRSSSSWTMPPPAQPRRAFTPSDVPYASSQPLTQPRAPAQLADNDLPPSSFPMPPSSFPDRPSSPSDTDQRASRRPEWSASEPLIRRVPPPICHALRPDPDASGDGRVLVENSDTASPGSQQVGMSQSQSQSQSQSENQDRSQDPESQQSQQQPSKLRNEIERARSCSVADEEDQDARPRGDEEVVQESQPRIDEDVSMAEAVEAPSHELQYPSQSQSHSEESQKSRQSLSYKGDSQSQDKSAEEPKAPEVEAIAPGTEGGPVYENEEAPAVGVLKKNLQPADAVGARVHPSPSPPLSPMHVDGPLHPAAQAPTWAAIRSSPSPDGGDDDSQEEEADVDELLSDPIDAEQGARSAASAKAKPRRNGGGNARGKNRLDPDDARTATMVNQYVLEVRLKDDGRPKPRSGATTARRASPTNAPCSRQPSPPLDDVPQERTMKRCKKDVEGQGPREDVDMFTREEPRKQPAAMAKGKQRERDGPPAWDNRKASPALSADELLLSSQPASHDPTVWAAPTFMRKPVKPKQDAVPPVAKVVEAASSTSSKAICRKRPASGSPEPPSEDHPAKKRKTSSTALPVIGPVAASGRDQQQPGRSTGKSSTAAKAPPARPAQESQKKPPQISVPAPASDAGNSSRNVKYLDLRAASRSSSRSSSRAPRADSHGSSAAVANRIPDEQPVAPGKGKAPVRSAQSEKKTASSSVPTKPPTLPVMSGGKTVSPRNVVRDAPGASRASSSSSRPAPTEGGARASARSVKVSPAPDAGSPGEGDRPLPHEYNISLDLVKEPNGPPVLDWEDVLRILKRTGAYRRRASSSARERDQ